MYIPPHIPTPGAKIQPYNVLIPTHLKLKIDLGTQLASLLQLQNPSLCWYREGNIHNHLWLQCVRVFLLQCELTPVNLSLPLLLRNAPEKTAASFTTRAHMQWVSTTTTTRKVSALESQNNVSSPNPKPMIASGANANISTTLPHGGLRHSSNWITTKNLFRLQEHRRNILL